MKRGMIFIIVILIVAAILVSPAYCSIDINGPIRKLGRGLWNMVTCPCELPNRIKKVTDVGSKTDAWTYGLFEGITMIGFRLAVGAFEVATFPFPLPEDYGPTLKDPEYFFLKDKVDE